MRLRDDWKHILRHAWSVRLIVIAALLSAAEAAFPFMEDYLGLPPQKFALLTALITFLAIPARLMAQKYTIKDKDDGE